MGRGVRPVRVDEVQRGDLVCTEKGKPLYTVESFIRIGDDVMLEVSRPDGERELLSWTGEGVAGELFVAVNRFRTVAVMDGREYLPVGDVRRMSIEVVRYLLSLEGALDPALVPHVDAALRESAYACLRSLAGVEEALV